MLLQIRRTLVHVVVELSMTLLLLWKIPLILFLPFTASLFDNDRVMNKLVIKQGPCSDLIYYTPTNALLYCNSLKYLHQNI